MDGIDYKGIRKAMAAWYQLKLGTSYEFISGAAARLGKKKLIGAGALLNRSGETDTSKMTGSKSFRRVQVLLVIVTDGKDSEERDDRLDDMIAQVEYYSNPIGHGAPIFGRTDVVRAWLDGWDKLDVGVAQMRINVEVVG